TVDRRNDLLEKTQIRVEHQGWQGALRHRGSRTLCGLRLARSSHRVGGLRKRLIGATERPQDYATATPQYTSHGGPFRGGMQRNYGPSYRGVQHSPSPPERGKEWR